jgi:16S rRNA (guanine966-N2)-methyltransferase
MESFVISNIMRIISGKYRGRRLKGPDRLELRPTGDRLKETLFNVLGPGVAGSVTLDVFGGSGAIGIEALSRGAREAVFIEHAAAGCRLIRHNLGLCGISTGYRIIQQDVFAALRSLARQDFKANIIFFDPPYDFKPYRDLLELVFNRNLLMQPSQVVIEHHRKAILPEAEDEYCRSRIIRQGDHCLSFYKEAKGSHGLHE